MKNDPLNKNNIRQYRKRVGLEQKQVAFLLNQTSTNGISRYEIGAIRPNLETALKLEVIYQVPVRLIYHKLFEHCQAEITERKRKQPQLLPDPYWSLNSTEQLKNEEFCFYGDLLKDRIPNELEIMTANKHVINLVKTITMHKEHMNTFGNN